MSMNDCFDAQPGTACADANAAATLDPQALERLRELDPGGHSKLLPRVAQAFATSVARLLPQMTTALEASDLAAIRHVAHTLKSSSASIGAIKLSQLCADIEALSRDGRADGLADSIAAFTSEVGAVQSALNRMLDNPS